MYIVKEFSVGDAKPYKIIGLGFRGEGNIVFPSPISNFIKSEYINKGKSLNSQRNAAYAVTRFLNYCYKNHDELRMLGLYALTLEHGAQYITKLSIQSRTGDKDSNYVKSQFNYLNRFFIWLLKNEILKSKLYKNNDADNVNIFELNDVEIIYPLKNTIKVLNIKTFGENRTSLIPLFINVARKTAPEIALGVGLQFFAGLRRSEVVNLTKSSLNWNQHTLTIKVRDNQKRLFVEYKNHSDVQVKKERDQVCLCVPIIRKLYEDHLNLIDKNKKNIGLFISLRNGKTLTGKQYWYRFEKVKNAFLEELLNMGLLHDYNFLSSYSWSTHIGRGIYTNILLDLNFTAAQIKIARGDENPESSQAYLDEHIMLENVNLAINMFDSLL